MLVCRHWRYVALSTPRLWRVIEVGKDLKWMGLAVSRSQNATLDISFWWNASVIASHPILLPVAERITVLTFNNVYEHQLAAALRLVNSAQSSLIKLCLARTPRERASWQDAFPNALHSVSFGRQRFPAMTALTIEGVRMTLQDPQAFFSRLRVLDVSRCLLLCDPPIFTVSTFLDVLARCAALEEVSLCGVLSQFHHDQPEHVGKSIQQSRIVSIPKLRKLTIQDKVEVVSSSLSSLLVPPNVRVQLVGELESLSEDWAEPGLFIPVLPLNWRQTLPILDTVRAVTLDIDLGIRAFSDHGGVEIALDIKDGHQDVPMSRTVDEAIQLFSNAPLTSLTIVAYMVDELEEAEWSRLFAGFRTLESFALSGMGLDTVRVFDALAESQLGEDGDPVVCPNLRKLRVSGPLWSDDTLQCVVECLATRARGNAANLEKLELQLGFDSYEDFEETKKNFLGEVGAVFEGEVEFGYDKLHS
ncbi:hypothetical protein LXA43DRAFT_204089 [Ganoderma leucocontextum]|nr:hypothetical protein LXA43DRAFT_204089 [Ganoderma leucocontextum]